jgi:putative endonuclease
VPDWFVYVLRCGDGSLYTGITTDVPRRLAEHASGGPKAAKYLRGRGPLELVFSAAVGGKSTALAMERWVKGLAKPRKELFAAGKLTWPRQD